jgi:hypothetical protein
LWGVPQKGDGGICESRSFEGFRQDIVEVENPNEDIQAEPARGPH